MDCPVKEKVFTIDKKQLDITYYSGTGNGGQHKNKHMNCVRIKHIPTRVIVTGQNHREKSSNMKDALTRLSQDKRVKAWVMGQINNIEEKLDASMKDIKVEIYKNGEWVIE